MAQELSQARVEASQAKCVHNDRQVDRPSKRPRSHSDSPPHRSHRARGPPPPWELACHRARDDHERRPPRDTRHNDQVNSHGSRSPKKSPDLIPLIVQLRFDEMEQRFYRNPPPGTAGNSTESPLVKKIQYGWVDHT